MKSRRRYALELLGALLLYAAVLAGSRAVVDAGMVPADWMIPLALLPLPVCVLVAWIIFRQLRQLDEMQQRVKFEAMAFSFTGTALITFSYGFLEGVGLPKQSMFMVWPVMAVLWVVGDVIACRRYR